MIEFACFSELNTCMYVDLTFVTFVDGLSFVWPGRVWKTMNLSLDHYTNRLKLYILIILKYLNSFSGIYVVVPEKGMILSII